jgi:hypothetical protein
MTITRLHHIAAVALLTAGFGLSSTTLSAQETQPQPQSQPLAAADSAFYLHINIDRMRNGGASAQLYQWLEREALDDLREEFGTEMIDQLAGISVFGSGAEQQPAIVLHGTTSQLMRDTIIDKLFDQDDAVELLSKHGRNYYAFNDIDINLDSLHINDIDSDTLFLAFGENDQTLITAAEDMLDSFLQRGSFQMDALPQDLLVIQANRALVQGGMNPKHTVFGDHGAWESSLFRNVEKFALVVADADDAINISVEAHSANSGAATALANIAQGILSLKALAQSEADDEDLNWLNQLKISNTDNITRFDVGLPIQQLLDILD